MLFTLREEGFIAQRYRFDGTVTVVDAGHIEQQLAAQYETVKQVALADLLVVSKGDLVDEETLARVEAQLAALNPAAPSSGSAMGCSHLRCWRSSAPTTRQRGATCASCWPGCVPNPRNRGWLRPCSRR